MSNRRIDTIVAIKINLYNIRLSIFVNAPLRYLRQLQFLLKLKRKHDNVLSIVAFQPKAFCKLYHKTVQQSSALTQKCARVRMYSDARFRCRLKAYAAYNDTHGQKQKEQCHSRKYDRYNRQNATMRLCFACKRCNSETNCC